MRKIAQTIQAQPISRVSAELNLAAVRLAENAALVQIYNSLGGGWEQ